MKTCPNASSVLINFHSRAVMEITSSETGKKGKKEGTEWGGRRRREGRREGMGKEGRTGALCHETLPKTEDR